MNAIYFIELKTGERYYKTDSFWSTSKDFTYAKLHNDDKYDQERFFKSFCCTLKPYESKEFTDEKYEKILRIKDSMYGYQKILSKGEQFSPDENSILSEPIYLFSIDSIDREGNVEWSDAVSIFRNKKLEKILN